MSGWEQAEAYTAAKGGGFSGEMPSEAPPSGRPPASPSGLRPVPPGSGGRPWDGGSALSKGLHPPTLHFEVLTEGESSRERRKISLLLRA